MASSAGPEAVTIYGSRQGMMCSKLRENAGREVCKAFVRWYVVIGEEVIGNSLGLIDEVVPRRYTQDAAMSIESKRD